MCIVGAGPAGLSAAIRLKQVRHASTLAVQTRTARLHRALREMCKARNVYCEVSK